MVDDPSEVVDETEVVVDSDSESPTNEQTAGLSPLATGTTGSGRTGSGGSAYSATDYEVQETVMAPNEARGGRRTIHTELEDCCCVWGGLFVVRVGTG